MKCCKPDRRLDGPGRHANNRLSCPKEVHKTSHITNMNNQVNLYQPGAVVPNSTILFKLFSVMRPPLYSSQHSSPLRVTTVNRSHCIVEQSNPLTLVLLTFGFCLLYRLWFSSHCLEKLQERMSSESCIYTTSLVLSVHARLTYSAVC